MDFQECMFHALKFEKNIIVLTTYPMLYDGFIGCIWPL